MSELAVTLNRKTVELIFNQTTRVVAINVIYNGSGGQGLDGKSAYEIALDNGFSGTENQWLESLIGSKGDKGDKGDTGAPGAKGDTGDPGAKGDKGDTGAPGAKGDTGDPGAKGDKGDTGAPGAKGDTGIPGADGAPKIISEFTTNTILTGVTTEQILATLPISASRLLTGKNYQALSYLQRTGTNNTIILRYRIGTSAVPTTITSETLLATSNVVSTNTFNPFNRRNIHVESPTSLLVYSATTAVVEDNAAATATSTLVVANTAQQYLYLTAQLLNGSDAIILHNFKLTE